MIGIIMIIASQPKIQDWTLGFLIYTITVQFRDKIWLNMQDLRQMYTRICRWQKSTHCGHYWTVRNTTMLRDLSKWLLPIVMIAVGGVLLWPKLWPKPQTMLACSFIKRSGVPIRTSDGNELAGRLWLEGSLKATTQDGMFGFEGTTIASEGKAPSDGYVWLDSKGVVEGMAVYASRADFGSDNLLLATINGDGLLDRENRTTAYLFLNPHEKLRHPADYVCNVSER